ncbi:hypothetical protein PR048_002209 [Dryococelus australis]|uniref:ABC transporter domain-containing protein n=1 Tax=Dryococelus australis TaxID=614101 RepID=A0ABQ9IJJ2_9NEOP|nr:hypothetical protein PR048_002209 [Dryococelus australis]
MMQPPTSLFGLLGTTLVLDSYAWLWHHMQDAENEHPVVVENGSFSWGKEESPVLKNINLSVNHGSLVAVVGTVGSGKSSLISALLGEMDKLSGRVNIKVSYSHEDSL